MTDLFGQGEWWREHWRGMPEFEQLDLTPFKTIEVHFREKADRDEFSKRVEQTITDRTRSIWYPEAEIGHFVDKRYRSASPRLPKHPIYIVSKGRWQTRLTSSSLSKLGVPHTIVVEPDEVARYSEAIESSADRAFARVLALDMDYKKNYDACDDLGDSKGKGPGGARNFAWDHSISTGATWHWVMDDNIDGFFRLHKNLKTPIADGTILRCMEAFVERYENVSMAGPNYFMFASRKSVMPPFVTNTRIYSCNLIRNDSPFRWRGRYNEDTDISLRMLKADLCTVQFNAFLQFKITTQTLGGGNTAEFYAKEGTRPKSEMQVKLHPDVSRVVWRFGRWHHFVDYSGFRKNSLRLRADVELPDGPDNFGMYLEVDDPGKAGSTPARSQRSGETGEGFDSPAVVSGETKARPASVESVEAESSARSNDWFDELTPAQRTAHFARLQEQSRR